MRRDNKKIYAFIDGQNLNLGVRDQGWILDLKRFRIYLKDKYKVRKAFYFIGYVKRNSLLYSFLKRAGYTLIFKPVLEQRYRGEKLIKGNVDAELVLHCAKIQFDNYDLGIIVSGDGDFHCLIGFLKKEGKLGGVFVPNRKAYSRLLNDFWRNLIFMNNLRNKLEKK